MGCWHFLHIVCAKNDLALKNTLPVILFFFLNSWCYLEKNCIKKSYQKRADTLFKQKPTCQTTQMALLPFTSSYQHDNPIFNNKYVKNHRIVRNFNSFSTLFFVFSKSGPYKIRAKHRIYSGEKQISIIWTDYTKVKNKFNYLLVRADRIFWD